MNEICLARVEPPRSLLSPVFKPSAPKKARWSLLVEASCWLLLATSSVARADLTFCLEYEDALKRHSVVIDHVQLTYFNDALVSGRFVIEGSGEFKKARLMLVGVGQALSVETRDLQFRVVRSSDRVNPRYRLVA